MFKQKIVFFLFLVLAVSLGMFSILKVLKSEKMIEAKSFKDGLKILVKKNTSNEIVAVNFFLNGGSGVEKAGEAGLTYLTARLLFKGTEDKNFAQIAREFDFLGAGWGLSVERDFSEIHLAIPKKYWKQGFKLFSEVLTNPVFPEEEIEKQKKLILQEIKNIDDNSFEYAYRAFTKNIYGSHPYAKMPIGLSETVERFTRTDILRHYKKCFCAGNSTIVFVGNLNFQEIKKIVKEEFKDFPKGEKLSLSFKPYESFNHKEILKKPDLQQALMFLGFMAPSVTDRDYAALKLISSLMGEGMSSRLFQNIRDKKGIGYALGSFYPTRMAHSPFVFYLGVQPDRFSESEAALWEEIRKIKFEKINPAELKKAQNYLSGIFTLSQQSNKSQAYFFGWFEILGLGPDFGLRYIESVKNLTAAQLKEAANKYFKEENAFFLALTPEG